MYRISDANVIYKHTYSVDQSVSYIGKISRQKFQRVADHKEKTCVVLLIKRIICINVYRVKIQTLIIISRSLTGVLKMSFTVKNRYHLRMRDLKSLDIWTNELELLAYDRLKWRSTIYIRLKKGKINTLRNRNRIRRRNEKQNKFKKCVYVFIYYFLFYYVQRCVYNVLLFIFILVCTKRIYHFGW